MQLLLCTFSLLLLFIAPILAQLPCSILISGAMLYLKPTYKYGLLLDKGAYTHHFVYSGPALSESTTEIPFTNNVAYLSKDWNIAAFGFPSIFTMTIDVRTNYHNEVAGDSSQVIFRKLKNDHTLFMEARVQVKAKDQPADLVVMTPSETKVFQDFFPVNVNQTYVEVGFSMVGSGHITVYKDGVAYYGDSVASPSQDDENHVSIVNLLNPIGVYIRRSHCGNMQSSLFSRRP